MWTTCWNSVRLNPQGVSRISIFDRTLIPSRWLSHRVLWRLASFTNDRLIYWTIIYVLSKGPWFSEVITHYHGLLHIGSKDALGILTLPLLWTDHENTELLQLVRISRVLMIELAAFKLLSKFTPSGRMSWHPIFD